MAGHAGFVVCGKCEGKGALVVQSSRGPLATDDVPCSKCRGSGLVATDELREAVARSLHDTDPVYSPPTWEDCDESTHRVWYYAQADAVLRVVTEHLEDRIQAPVRGDS